MRNNRFRFFRLCLHQARQEKTQRGNTLRGVDATTAGAKNQEGRKQRKPEKKPIPFHRAIINIEYSLATTNSAPGNGTGGKQAKALRFEVR
jgi:hypothetical protein